MASIQQVVVDYLSRRELPVEAADSPGIYTLPARGRNGSWPMFVTPREAEHQLLVHSLLPETVPAERRTEMALFLTRANFGMVLGNFEMDLSDGELRFKTSLDVEGAELVEPMVDMLMVANVSTMDNYLPGIRAVLDGAPAAEAIAQIED